MKELRSIANKRALVIVAHPDDEIIWMGGTIRKQTGIDWTIFSLCRQDDADREPKFKRVCAYCGAKGIIADLDDKDALDKSEAKARAKALIKKKIKADDYDYIFTHGANGEYGHPRHVAVYEAVKELLSEKYLKPEAVFYFNYLKKNGGNTLSPALKSLVLNLTPAELKEKKRIVAEMYGYPWDGIDVGYCTNPEAFLRQTAA